VPALFAPVTPARYVVLTFSLAAGVKVTFTHGAVQLTEPLTVLPDASVKLIVAEPTISLKGRADCGGGGHVLRAGYRRDRGDLGLVHTPG